MSDSLDKQSPTAINLFAYGSLMIPEVIQAVICREVFGESATLVGYLRQGLLGFSYPGLVKCPDASVDGRLYRDLSANDLLRLDAFEDDFYQRQTLTVQSRNGGINQASVYVITPESTGLLDGRPWCVETFRRQHLRGFLSRYGTS
jgi:gamma-glutamylcyclotransferase (GGCT)/AIG2-like uncharacterized protein YtfP